MKYETIEFLIKNYKKGTFLGIDWKTPKTSKDGKEYYKVSSAVARLGIDYAHIVETPKTDYESTTVWKIKDYVKISSKGNELLMVYTGANNKVKTHWEDSEGNIVNYEDIEPTLYAKDKTKGNTDLTVFTLNIKNITRIGSLTAATV